MNGTSQPGLPVLRHLPVWIKLLGAGLALILPALLSLTWLQQSQQREVQDANSGILSTKLALACGKVLGDLQALRVTTVALASGDNRLANEVGTTEVKGAEADLQAVAAAQPIDQDRWNALAELIRAILKAAPHMHAQESVTRYADATEKVQGYLDNLLARAPGDHQDPGTIASLHLAVLCQNLLHHYGSVSELVSSRGALRQNLNGDDQAEVIRVSALIDNDSSEIDSAYRKLLEIHPELRASLQDGADTCRSTCTTFEQYLQSGVLANGGDLPVSVHAHLLSALEGDEKFLDALLGAASQQIEARQRLAGQTLIHQERLLGSLLLIGGLVGVLVLWDLLGALHNLQRSAQVLAGWDFSVPLPAVQRQDELGQVQIVLHSLVEVGGNFMRSLQETAAPLAETSAQLVRALKEQSAPPLSGSALGDANASLDRIRRSAQTVTQGLEAIGQSLQQAAQIAVTCRQSADLSQQDCQHTTDQVEAVTPDALNLNEAIQKLTALIASLRESAEASAQQLGEVGSKLSWLIIEGKAQPHDQTGPALSAAENAVRGFMDRSAAALRQMRELLGELQQSANVTATSTLEAGRQARAGLQGISETAVAARKLSNTLTTTSHVAIQTAQALPELMSEVDKLSTAFWGIRSDGSALTQVQQTAQNQAQRVAQLSHALQVIIDPGKGP